MRWRWRFRFPFRSGQSTRRFPSDDQVVLFATRPLLCPGFDEKSYQQAVKDLQTILQNKGFRVNLSGEYDDTTEREVRDFQEKNDLFPDGIVGPFTWAALYHPRLSRRGKSSPEIRKSVEKLQTHLCQEGFPTKIDGCFSRKTEGALKRFQKSYGLEPDGICGPMTWAVLLGQKNKPAAGFFVPRRELFEQLLMVASIYAGILMSPLGSEPPLAESLVTSYGLVCIVPPLIEHLKLELLSLPLLQFSPYILIGFFWNPVLDSLKTFITQFLQSQN